MTRTLRAGRTLATGWDELSRTLCAGRAADLMSRLGELRPSAHGERALADSRELVPQRRKHGYPFDLRHAAAISYQPIEGYLVERSLKRFVETWLGEEILY
jgi:hypothetical protein